MNKVILIIGGGSEVGISICERLLSSGGNTVILTSSSQKSLSYIKSLERVYKGKILFQHLDITSFSDSEKVVKKILRKFKKVDVLINIAGISINGPTLGFSVEDFSNLLKVNLLGIFQIIKLVGENMKKRRNGKIINITSLNGVVPLPNFGLYSASKHALEAMGQSLDTELRGYDIRVVNIAPGAISTNTQKKIDHQTIREKSFIFKKLLPFLSIEDVSRKIEQVIAQKNPSSSIVLGRDAIITYLLYRFLPRKLWSKLLVFIWNL